jgi:hypothetical protein
LRVQALARPEVGDFLMKHCVAVYDKVGTFKVNVAPDGKTPIRDGGNVAAFFCSPSGYVIHAVAGPRTGEAFLAEAKWAVAAYTNIVGERGLGSAAMQSGQVPRVTPALRQAHGAALELITKPNPFAPGLELVHHKPSPDPAQRGLEQAGLKQREQVHRLLRSRAFEPLTVVGPEVYTKILGEKVTTEAVELTGATEARQAAGTGQSLVEFYSRDKPDDAGTGGEPRK